MKCPYCSAKDTRVIDSRESDETVRRRRECPTCGQRFTTHERADRVALSVVKKDGRREEYDRAKLARGIRIACTKRPVPVEAVETAIDRIESKIFSLGKSEVPSSFIGELVMEKLRDLDGVAYVRFASVYREFRDLDGLLEHIEDWQEWRRRTVQDDRQLQFDFEKDQPLWS